MFKSIIAAVLLSVVTISSVAADEYAFVQNLDNLTAVQQVKFDNASSKLDLFAEEVEAARTSNVRGGYTHAVTYNDAGATVIGEVIKVEFVNDHKLRLRAARSTFHQFRKISGTKDQITEFNTDLIIQFEDVGMSQQEWVVTGFWGAAENH